MKRILSLLLITALLLSSLPINSLAHSGRTDKNGGHWDRKKGTYHYHGSGSSSTNKSSKTSNTTSTKTVTTTKIVKKLPASALKIYKTNNTYYWGVRPSNFILSYNTMIPSGYEYVWIPEFDTDVSFAYNITNEIELTVYTTDTGYINKLSIKLDYVDNMDVNETSKELAAALLTLIKTFTMNDSEKVAIISNSLNSAINNSKPDTVYAETVDTVLYEFQKNSSSMICEFSPYDNSSSRVVASSTDEKVIDIDILEEDEISANTFSIS